MTQPGNSLRRQRPPAILPVAGLCLVLLTACGGGPTLVAPPTSTPVAAEPVPATAAAPASTPAPRPTGLGEIRWSSNEITAATPAAGLSQLTTDAPRIVANLPAYAVPAGSQVAAAWSYNDTSLDAFATTLTIDQPQEEQWLTFQLTRNTETPWPVGVYEITVSLNGQTAQTGSIEVVAPA